MWKSTPARAALSIPELPEAAVEHRRYPVHRRDCDIHTRDSEGATVLGRRGLAPRCVESLTPAGACARSEPPRAARRRSAAAPVSRARSAPSSELSEQEGRPPAGPRPPAAAGLLRPRRPTQVAARAGGGRHPCIASWRDGERQTLVGRIVEVEAYFGRRQRSGLARARGGRLRRNAAMFGPPGQALRLSKLRDPHLRERRLQGRAGCAEAVLLRALEPVAGSRHA